MNSISWLSRGEIVALGWTLLHFCWQGTAVAVAYSVADRMTSRATSGVRYAVALIALLLMPVVVAATFVEEMRVAAPPHATERAATAIPHLPLDVRHGPVLQEIPLTLSLAVDQPNAWLVGRTERVLPWVDSLWMLGMLLLAVRAMGGWWQLERVEQIRSRPRNVLCIPGHERETVHERRSRRNLIRLATQTCPKSVLLGFALRSEKFHVLPQRTPRRAARPAINSRRTHAKKKHAVRTRIPCHGRLPILFRCS